MRVLITGASGQLGAYLLRHARQTSASVVAWTGQTSGERFGFPLRPIDLTDSATVRSAFRLANPDVVVHAAALARVADCAANPGLAQAINQEATSRLAELARSAHIRFVYVSTDLVFDGDHGPYDEEQVATPRSVYGQTKRNGEQDVLAQPGGVVVRVSLLYGPSLTGRPTFFDEQCQALRTGQPLRLFHDEWRTPLGLNVAASALWELAHADGTGLFHLGGPERLSRLEMGQRLADFLGVSAHLVSLSRADFPSSEPRPRDTSLDSRRWRRQFPHHPWPGWEETLHTLMTTS